MNIPDLSKGIIRDPDARDRPMDSAEELVNYDLLPGRTLKRRGTSAKTFAIRDDAVNTIPKSNETIVQVVAIDAPMAKYDSIKGPWPTLIVYPFFGDITDYFHDQPAVTVILVKLTDVAGPGGQNRYALYADTWVKDEFDLITYGTDDWFYAVDDETVPFIIPRKNGCAIGGVLIDREGYGDTEKGVLWFGHIKKQLGWHRTDGGGSAATYDYLYDVDDWQLCNAELYDAEEHIGVRLGIGSFETLYSAGSTSNDDIDDVAKPAETVIERHLEPIVLGGPDGPKKVRLKCTAVYDWYQESRPLRWDESLYDLIDFENFTAAIDACEAELPYGWNVKSINDGRGVELELGKQDVIHCGLFASIDTLREFGQPSDPAKYTGEVRLRWRWPYDKNATNKYHGEDVPLFINYDDPWPYSGNKTHGRTWSVEWNDELTIIEKLVLRPNYFPWPDGGSPFENSLGYGIYRSGVFVDPGKTLNALPWKFLMYLLGYPPETSPSDSTTGMSDAEYWIHHAWWGWYDMTGSFHRGAQAAIDDLPSENNFREWREYFDVVQVNTDYNSGVTPDGEDETACLVLDGGSVQIGTFGQDTESGRGFCFMRPYVPSTYFSTDFPSDTDDMKRGGSRLTSFRLYMQEDEVDADYRMIAETWLDENPYDPDHHGVPSEIVGVRPYDEQEGASASAGLGDAPMWMLDIHPDSADSIIWPAFHPTVTRFLTGEGLLLRAFVPRKFIVSNTAVRTKEGSAILSQQLLRDESERDNPQWARGSVCTKRILGPNMKTGQCQYSLIAGGIPQWDICPGDIDIDMNDEVQHVVTWRGNHHIVFTDKALWRIDMATSDELTWRVMNTFWHSGTKLWQTIHVAPEGVFFVNQEGIWMYRGDLPISVIEGKWQRYFEDYYSGNLATATATCGFNKREQCIYFCPGYQVESLDYVWLYDIRYNRWRRYLYASGRPYYMTYHENEFLLSAGANDCWKVDYSVYSDKEAGYTTYGRTQPVHNRSAVHHEYYTHLGVDYEHLVAATNKLRVRVLQGEYYGKLAGSNPAVLLPNSRYHYFFPLPMGHGRLLQITFGQGTYFLDDNDTEAHEFLAFNLRGSANEQWDQTNTGDIPGGGGGT
jgi:hypothetical protein